MRRRCNLYEDATGIHPGIVAEWEARLRGLSLKNTRRNERRYQAFKRDVMRDVVHDGNLEDGNSWTQPCVTLEDDYSEDSFP